MSTGPLGNQAYQQRKRDREKLVLRQANVDLRTVASTPSGRRFLWNLLGRCDFFTKIPAGNEGLQRNGRRDLAIDILGDLYTADPAAYRALFTEGNASKDEEAVHAKDAALSLANQESE